MKEKNKFNTNFATLPLTSGSQETLRVPDRSGLNWGQRPGRNQDQAYIRIPSDIQKNGFFPDKGIPFKVVCDDGFEMTMVRAQENGKALHTSEDNAIIGAYFRKRLGLSSGDLVTINHLRRYGRLTVDIHKIDDFNFTLDFSKMN